MTTSTKYIILVAAILIMLNGCNFRPGNKVSDHAEKLLAQGQITEATKVANELVQSYHLKPQEKAKIDSIVEISYRIRKDFTLSDSAVLQKLVKYQPKINTDDLIKLEKATKIDASNRWFWAGMYDVCYDTQEYNKAIPIVEKLIEFKEEYKNDLASLYMNTQQFDKALTLINELNSKFGKDDKRDIYKAQILRDSKFQGPEKSNLIEQIAQNPKEESNYINALL